VGSIGDMFAILEELQNAQTPSPQSRPAFKAKVINIAARHTARDSTTPTPSRFVDWVGKKQR